jgi:capsular exopolysaccharide synthesis family protein
MPEPGVEPSIRGYLHVLRQGRWWIAACSLLGLVLGLCLSLTATKQYSATAQLLVLSTGSINLTTGAQAAITSTDVQTELQLVNSAPVQNEVLKQLGRIPGISADQVGQTNVIAVTAVSPTPSLAAKIANAYASAFVNWSTATTISNLAAAEKQLTGEISAIGKQISQLRSATSAQASALSSQQAVLKGQLAQLQVTGASASTGLQLVTPATVPTSPTSPKPVEETLLGLVAGLVVGIGAAFLRDSLDDTLANGAAVELVSGTPVLATVPMVPMLRKTGKRPLVSVTAPTSQPAEAYRSLRTSLQFAGHDRPLRTFLVTSPRAGDGKTTTVVNLGAVFAQAGARVVLLSSDLRRPGLSEFIAPGEHADLSSVLTGEHSLDQAVTRVPGVEGLSAVVTRASAANPTELLAGQRMHGVIAELSERFDVVLIDSPPVLPVADAMILSSYVDAVLLVVSAGQTRRGELRRTAEKLAQAKASVVGAVLNKASAQEEYGYYGGYQPYVLPENDSKNGGAARHGRGKHNGAPLSSGQPGRIEN